MKSYALLALPALLTGPTTDGAESYICSVKAQTAFVFEQSSKTWRPIAIGSLDKQYVVARSTNGNPKVTWRVKEIGTDYTTYYCENDFDKNGYLSCSGIVAHFKMNRQTLRFIVSYEFGYYEIVSDSLFGKPYHEGDDSPHMEIGTCSSF